MPASARIAPPFSINASTLPCSTASFTGPPKSSVTLEPAPSSTWPWLASSVPAFVIFAAISAIVPPPLPSPTACTLPWFTMALLESPANW